jgi:hypothetical protein
MLTGGGGWRPPKSGLNAGLAVKDDAALEDDAALVVDAVAGVTEPDNAGRMLEFTKGADESFADSVFTGDDAATADVLGTVATGD